MAVEVVRDLEALSRITEEDHVAPIGKAWDDGAAAAGIL
jgi:hypothetical protein